MKGLNKVGCLPPGGNISENRFNFPVRKTTLKVSIASSVGSQHRWLSVRQFRKKLDTSKRLENLVNHLDIFAARQYHSVMGFVCNFRKEG